MIKLIRISEIAYEKLKMRAFETGLSIKFIASDILERQLKDTPTVQEVLRKLNASKGEL